MIQNHLDLCSTLGAMNFQMWELFSGSLSMFCLVFATKDTIYSPGIHLAPLDSNLNMHI